MWGNLSKVCRVLGDRGKLCPRDDEDEADDAEFFHGHRSNCIKSD